MTATIEARRSGGGGLLWLIIGGGLLWMALSAATAGMEAESYTVSAHAVERHGTIAEGAVEHLNTILATGKGPYHKEDCRDGKELYTFRYNGQLWAVLVRGTKVLTAFDTDQKYLANVRNDDGCGNGLQLGTHDLANMQMPSLAY